MKIILMLLMAGLSSPAYANSYLWDNEWEEDNYVGIQLSIPLDKKPQANLLSDVEFSALLVESANGYSQGFVWSFEDADTYSLSYLRPAADFSVAGSNIKDRSLIIFNSEDNNTSLATSNLSGEGPELLVYVVAMTFVLFDALGQAVESIFKGLSAETNEGDSSYTIPALRLLADPRSQQTN